MYIMSNNSWKQYGGIYRTNKFHNFSIGTLVADDILLRQKYSGEFEVLGSINVQETVFAAGIEIKSNNNLILDLSTNSIFYSKLYFGDSTNNANLSTDYLTGGTGGIGINTNDASGTFHVVGQSGNNHDLVVSSENTQSSSILTKNMTDKGIRVVATDVSSALLFYNDNTVGDSPNAGIIYTSEDGGKLSINTPLLQFGDTNHIPFIPEIYGNLNIFTGNSLSLASAYDDIANTFLNVTSKNGRGFGIGGGVFPNDTAEEFATIGLKNVNDKYRSAMTIISNNTIEPQYGYTSKQLTRTGVNTHAPNDNYSFNVNGKMRLENGEINNAYILNVEPNRVISNFATDTNPEVQSQLTYFTGSSKGLKDTNGEYTYGIYESDDGGIKWNFTDLTDKLIDDIKNNNIKIYISSPLRFLSGNQNVPTIFRAIATKFNYFLFNRGTTWYTLSITNTNSSTNFPPGADFKYIEAVLRQDNYDNYLILIFQQTDGSSYYIDFGANTSSQPFGSTSSSSSLFYATGDKTVNYGDISNSIVSIDLKHGGMNDTIHDSLNFDNNNLYIAGNKGFYKFPHGLKNGNKSTLGDNVTTISAAEHYNISYRNNTIIAVGDGIITYSTNGGSSFGSHTSTSITSITDKVLRFVEIVSDDEIYIVGDGIILYHHEGISRINQSGDWKSMPESLLNASGNGNILLGTDSKLNYFRKIDNENFMIGRIQQPFDDSNNQEGIMTTHHLYSPGFLNFETNTILDISGNVTVDGNFDIRNKLRVASFVTSSMGVNLGLNSVTEGYNLEIAGSTKQEGVVHQF